ncbi:MAG: sigma-54-dependent Fis family transcriptional regulator [Bacteroidetes bacterium]|nr:sigma-54-dependent Fis family transcriptional regulator [Bacteroidota bacterium]
MRADRILIVDDENLIRWALRNACEQAGYEVIEASTVHGALENIRRYAPDLILLDHLLADGTGLDVLEHIHAHATHVAVIMITAVDTSDVAVKAMKLGAMDYITKPINTEAMLLLVERCLEMTRLKRRFAFLLRDQEESAGFFGLIGSSPQMQLVVEAVKKYAAAPETTVLITGESGTGKELVAQAIHRLSDRRDEAFITINCAALPPPLIESELFGHERGAFTDARAGKKGLFEIAHGGGIFFDEIGDLSIGLQGVLLRVLEQKSFRRLGGVNDISVNVRIITATNQDLAQRIAENRFRPDLFYRLNVARIHLPPLRQRGDDIVELAEYYLHMFNTTFRKSFSGLTERTQSLFLQYPWPGNVRELRNVIERAVLTQNGELIDVQESQLGAACSPGKVSTVTVGRSQPSLEEVERETILGAMQRSGNNQSEAARLLNISRDTLRYRLKKLGITDSAHWKGER